MARYDNGARSPLAPTEPFSGITGITSRLSSSASACRVAARMPEFAHQRIDANRQHRTYDFDREWLADTHSVRDDEIVLQLLHQRALAGVGLPPGSSSRARCAPSSCRRCCQSRRHSVDRLAAFHLCGKKIGRALNLGELRAIQRHARAVRDRGNVLSRIRLLPEDNGCGHAGIACSLFEFHTQVFTRSARSLSN